jgi:hypothetical protein
VTLKQKKFHVLETVPQSPGFQYYFPVYYLFRTSEYFSSCIKNGDGSVNISCFAYSTKGGVPKGWRKKEVKDA